MHYKGSKIRKKMAKLNEDTLDSFAPTIASADQKLPIIDVFQQTKLPSLGRSVFYEVKLNGPSAGIFNLTDDGHDLKLVRENLNCFPCKTINTKLTQESLQDLVHMYGEQPAYKYVSRMLRGLCNMQENEKTLEFLRANSVDDGPLNLSDKLNSETQMFEITNKVQKLCLKINSLTQRTFSAFAIIPYEHAGSIMTTYAYTTGDNTTDINELLVADFALMKYYVNPDPNDMYAYVGLRSNVQPYCSSAFFGEFTNDLQLIHDPDTGNLIFYIYNRFGICKSPLNTADNPMLYKFEIKM